MPLEKGDLKPDVISDETKELRLMLEMMQKELADLKASKVTNLPSQGGLNPTQFAELLRETIKSAKQKPDPNISAYNYVNEEEIDKEDIDEVGTLFCSYGTGYLIVDDLREGLPVLPPFKKPISLVFQGMNKTRDEHGKEVLNTFCAYTSHSKKEAEWLRKHKLFGIRFFESATEAISKDASKAQKLVKFISGVMNMDQSQVVSACRQYGVGINRDIHSMRIALAYKMMEESDKRVGESYTKILEENKEQELFKEDKTRFTRR